MDLIKKINILKDVDIEKEKIKFLKDCNDHARRHLEYAFNEFKFWYKVLLKDIGFQNLYIGASPKFQENTPPPYYPLTKGIDEINDNRALLDKKNEHVNTKRVGYYYKKLQLGEIEILENIFIVQKKQIASQDLYIIDGMHRLLAYGLRIKDGIIFQNFEAYLGWETPLIWKKQENKAEELIEKGKQ